MISYIFTKNSSSLSEDMNFYFFDFNYFCQFCGFFTFTCYKKVIDFRIYKIGTVFWLGIILDRLFWELDLVILIF